MIQSDPLQFLNIKENEGQKKKKKKTNKKKQEKKKKKTDDNQAGRQPFPSVLCHPYLIEYGLILK